MLPAAPSNPFAGIQGFVQDLSNKLDIIEEKVDAFSGRIKTLEQKVDVLKQRFQTGQVAPALSARIESTRKIARIAHDSTVGWEYRIKRELCTKSNAEIMAVCGTNKALKLRALAVILRHTPERAQDFLMKVDIAPRDPILQASCTHLSEALIYKEIMPLTLEGTLLLMSSVSDNVALRQVLIKDLVDRLGCNLGAPCVTRAERKIISPTMVAIQFMISNDHPRFKDFLPPDSRLRMNQLTTSFFGRCSEFFKGYLADPDTSPNFLHEFIQKQPHEVSFEAAAKRTLFLASHAPRRFLDTPQGSKYSLLYLLCSSKDILEEARGDIYTEVLSKLAEAFVLTQESISTPFNEKIEIRGKRRASVYDSILPILYCAISRNKCLKLPPGPLNESVLMCRLIMGDGDSSRIDVAWDKPIKHPFMGVTAPLFQWALFFDDETVFKSLGAGEGWVCRIMANKKRFGMAYGKCLQMLETFGGVNLSMEYTRLPLGFKTAISGLMGDEVHLEYKKDSLQITSGSARVTTSFKYEEIAEGFVFSE